MNHLKPGRNLTKETDIRKNQQSLPPHHRVNPSASSYPKSIIHKKPDVHRTFPQAQGQSGDRTSHPKLSYAMQQWLGQDAREEPWRPGTRCKNDGEGKKDGSGQGRESV
ncbi:hypothetical protein MMC14_000243 [Varicellaria rhodocarpa]|nr:hypothetical protein [Varicellaria rhodocarpa]